MACHFCMMPASEILCILQRKGEHHGCPYQWLYQNFKYIYKKTLGDLWKSKKYPYLSIRHSCLPKNFGVLQCCPHNSKQNSCPRYIATSFKTCGLLKVAAFFVLRRWNFSLLCRVFKTRRRIWHGLDAFFFIFGLALSKNFFVAQIHSFALIRPFICPPLPRVVLHDATLSKRSCSCWCCSNLRWERRFRGCTHARDTMSL